MSKIRLIYQWLVLKFPIILDIWHWFFRPDKFARADYSRVSAELIALTQRVWSKSLGHEIPASEAIEIIRSFRNFLELLKEIKRNGKQ
jgi:hypothetical protein